MTVAETPLTCPGHYSLKEIACCVELSDWIWQCMMKREAWHRGKHCIHPMLCYMCEVSTLYILRCAELSCQTFTLGFLSLGFLTMFNIDTATDNEEESKGLHISKGGKQVYSLCCAELSFGGARHLSGRERIQQDR